MDVLWSLGLVVFLLIALNHMAGGKASGVIRPVTGIVNRLLSFAVRTVTGLLGSVFRIGAGSVKLPKPNPDKETGRGPGPPAPRWKD